MKPRLWWVFSASAFFSLLAILLWPELIRELLVIPLTYFIGIANLVYLSIDQLTLWVALILVGVVFFWMSLKFHRAPIPDIVYPDVQESSSVLRWQRHIKDARRGAYMRWRLAQRLAGLTDAALACCTGFPPERLPYDELDLPAEIEAYLRAAQKFQAGAAMSRRWFSSPAPQPLNLPPEVIVTYIEQCLAPDRLKSGTCGV